MILFCGRIEPGSGCGDVFTGQSLLANPALTAATSARLSFFVRPLIVGTASGGSFGAESLPVIPAVLGREADTVDEADTNVDEVVRESDLVDANATGGSPIPIWSPVVDGRASRPAAQPVSAAATKTSRRGVYEFVQNALSRICSIIRREVRLFFYP